jgi:predicted dehydrogenase
LKQRRAEPPDGASILVRTIVRSSTIVKPLRAAVVGVGYFGALHAQKFAALPGVELAAVVDVDPRRSAEVAQRLGTRACRSLAEMPGDIDVASVAVPTAHHADVASRLIDAGVHVLVEKPMVCTLAEADALIAAAHARGVLLQVGHLERFNGALAAVRDRIVAPMFIEAHRLAPFKSRSTDVDIVLDVMIHDLDLILDLVPSPVREVRANGTPVLTDHVDIAHARLEFESGCVANLTASRVSTKSMRKTRIFERDCYLSIDLQSGEVTIAARRAGPGPLPGLPAIELREFAAATGDPLMAELSAFVTAVRGREPVPVGGDAGRRALEVALEIRNRIEGGAPG